MIKEKHLSPHAPPPLRTKTPLRLSQDSAVAISITPLVLSEAAGAAFKTDIPTDHKIIAVGQYSLFGNAYYRCYLSNLDGGFLHFAMRTWNIAETRLYRPMPEITPTTADEWAFWLDDNGFIGNPDVQSPEGNKYLRTWAPSDQHIMGYQVIETIVDASGATTTVRHQMMQYQRALNDPKLVEHLLVSATQTDTGMAVNLWLGLDVTPQDLTVFASADAPV